MDERVLRDLLGRRDPHGYYVVPVASRFADEVKRLVEQLKGAVVENAGDIIIVRVRSRSVAARIAKWALRRKALVTEF